MSASGRDFKSPPPVKTVAELKELFDQAKNPVLYGLNSAQGDFTNGGKGRQLGWVGEEQDNLLELLEEVSEYVQTVLKLQIKDQMTAGEIANLHEKMLKEFSLLQKNFLDNISAVVRAKDEKDAASLSRKNVISVLEIVIWMAEKNKKTSADDFIKLFNLFYDNNHNLISEFYNQKLNEYTKEAGNYLIYRQTLSNQLDQAHITHIKSMFDFSLQKRSILGKVKKVLAGLSPSQKDIQLYQIQLFFNDILSNKYDRDQIKESLQSFVLRPKDTMDKQKEIRARQNALEAALMLEIEGRQHLAKDRKREEKNSLLSFKESLVKKALVEANAKNLDVKQESEIKRIAEKYNSLNKSVMTAYESMQKKPDAKEVYAAKTLQINKKMYAAGEQLVKPMDLGNINILHMLGFVLIAKKSNITSSDSLLDGIAKLQAIGKDPNLLQDLKKFNANDDKFKDELNLFLASKDVLGKVDEFRQHMQNEFLIKICAQNASVGDLDRASKNYTLLNDLLLNTLKALHSYEIDERDINITKLTMLNFMAMRLNEICNKKEFPLDPKAISRQIVGLLKGVLEATNQGMQRSGVTGFFKTLKEAIKPGDYYSSISEAISAAEKGDADLRAVAAVNPDRDKVNVITVLLNDVQAHKAGVILGQKTRVADVTPDLDVKGYHSGVKPSNANPDVDVKAQPPVGTGARKP